MDLTNRTDIKNLLEKYGAKPEKYLGQHFLLSKRALRQMVGAADIQKNDTVVEIGPGLGVLTRELAKTGANVIAIEKDDLMVLILKETLDSYKNASVIQADARKINWNDFYQQFIPKIANLRGSTYEVDRKSYKIVANLPYNIANFLIRSWLEAKDRPERIVVMVQKEVARRICAKPPKMNLLAVSTQFYAIARIMKYVSAEAFWPKPKVDSAILLIKPQDKYVKQLVKKRAEHITSYVLDRAQKDFVLWFFDIVKAGFSQPRKQLAGNLVKKLKISREKILEIFKILNISETVRAENLTLENWVRLSESF